VARPPRDLTVVVKLDASGVLQALADLQAAEARYRALLAGDLTCLAPWPHDPPGPSYEGTRCGLLKDHGEDVRHRCGTVEW